MCQGLGPKRHDEISEIDHTGPCRGRQTPAGGPGSRAAARRLKMYVIKYVSKCVSM